MRRFVFVFAVALGAIIAGCDSTTGLGSLGGFVLDSINGQRPPMRLIPNQCSTLWSGTDISFSQQTFDFNANFTACAATTEAHDHEHGDYQLKGDSVILTFRDIDFSLVARGKLSADRKHLEIVYPFGHEASPRLTLTATAECSSVIFLICEH
jgi:hypothetical protein